MSINSIARPQDVDLTVQSIELTYRVFKARYTLDGSKRHRGIPVGKYKNVANERSPVHDIRGS